VGLRGNEGLGLVFDIMNFLICDCVRDVFMIGALEL